jgi:hypothetical protein
MNKMGSNPFGASTVIGLSRTAAKTVSKDGDEGKKIDLVSIYLATVPSLQKAKEELEKVKAALKDSGNSPKCDEWVEKITTVMEDILDHTKVAIRGEIEEASPSKDAAAGPAISADMISGRAPIPEGTLRQAPTA